MKTIKTHGAYNEESERADGQKGHHVTHLLILHACVRATQISVRLAPVQDFLDSLLKRISVAS